jgi:ABC-2 type transport system permease protein
MSKILLITRRELQVKFKSVWFWLTALLIPLGIILVVSISIFASYLGNSGSDNSDTKTLILDQSRLVAASLTQDDKKTFEITDKNEEQLRQTILDKGEKSRQTALIIPATAFSTTSTVETERVQLLTGRSLGLSQDSQISALLNRVAREQRLKQLNLSKEQLEQVNKPVSWKSTIISKDNTSLKGNIDIAYVVGYMVTSLIYTVSVIFGAVLMMSIIEEKSSRVIEVLLSAVSPLQLLVGKIIGQIIAIFTQIVLTGIFSTIIFTAFGIGAVALFLSSGQVSNQVRNILTEQKEQPAQVMDTIKQISSTLETSTIERVTQSWFDSLGIDGSGLFFWAGIYLVIGILYSMIWYAAIASTSDSYQAASNSSLSWLLSIPSILSFVFIPAIINEPDGLLARFLSFFPLTSYTIMPTRLAFGVASWELALSIILSVAGLFASFWICARIYRTGLLMYGKTANLAEIWRWIRQS